jgi:hypothetical protein
MAFSMTSMEVFFSVAVALFVPWKRNSPKKEMKEVL